MNIETFYPIYKQSKSAVIDSRKVEEGDVFFAFSGENYNAATAARDAISKGAKAVIVEDKSFEDESNHIYYVESTLQFLQDLARHHRVQLQVPVVGLTGSNGKTTTKELISVVLAKKFNTQFTKGNLNNHIGVPLTILSIREEHTMAVVEMGANHQKEIEFLCTISRPEIGYITNFGKAHLEGFGGFEGVIKGKSELYNFLIDNGKTLLINESDCLQLEKSKNYSNKITFGLPNSQYNFTSFSNNHFVGIVYNGIVIQSKLTGEYNFNNLSAAVSLGLHFEIPIEDIKSAIEEYTPTNMRSQVVKENGKTLVLDTYNANPSSMAESLKNFKTFEGSKTIIIGDMLELGEESEKEHQNIINLATSLGFDSIITVGPNFQKVNVRNSFTNVQGLISYLENSPINTQNILLKGSRGIALEKALDIIKS